MSDWCNTLDLARQFSSAATIRRELLVVQREQFKADDPRLAAALNQLGQSLLNSQQFADAEPILTECQAIRERALPDSWLKFNAKSLLGSALAGQSKFVEAEPLLVAGYEGIKQRETKIPDAFRTVRLTEALQRLIDLYTAWDKPNEVAKWRKTLEADDVSENP